MLYFHFVGARASTRRSTISVRPLRLARLKAGLLVLWHRFVLAPHRSRHRACSTLFFVTDHDSTRAIAHAHVNEVMNLSFQGSIVGERKGHQVPAICSGVRRRLSPARPKASMSAPWATKNRQNASSPRATGPRVKSAQPYRASCSWPSVSVAVSPNATHNTPHGAHAQHTAHARATHTHAWQLTHDR